MDKGTQITISLIAFFFAGLVTACPAVMCDAMYINPESDYSQLKKEREFQEATCIGEIEVVMTDRTRVDCLTETHAIEYDFANKWAEAVGQSLYYSFQTNKKAGIVLIYKKPEDVRYYHRLMSVIADNALKIDVWIVNKD